MDTGPRNRDRTGEQEQTKWQMTEEETETDKHKGEETNEGQVKLISNHKGKESNTDRK